jgi:serine/threonine protein kinase
MWALGVLLFALLVGAYPFKGATEKELYARIQRGAFIAPKTVSREARQVMSKLMEVDPSKRA